jgi:hypothetical protein
LKRAKWTTLSRAALVCTAFVLASLPAPAATLLTFEGLADLQLVDNFYTGVTFTNAIAAIAGKSLASDEFPPASAVTVAASEGPPITIAWDAPIVNFQALFTHSSPLTLQFFLGANPVGTAASFFTDNRALSGELGSFPNEAISFHRSLGFDSVILSGRGGFTMDDVSFGGVVGDPAPEPGTTPLMVVGVALVCCGAYRRTRPAKR